MASWCIVKQRNYKGGNQFYINLQNIAFGSYIVTIQNNGETKKEKLIVVQ
jgi:hypothetical protein